MFMNRIYKHTVARWGAKTLKPYFAIKIVYLKKKKVMLITRIVDHLWPVNLGQGGGVINVSKRVYFSENKIKRLGSAYYNILYNTHYTPSRPLPPLQIQ